jgi:hypothetical protein
LVDYSRARSSRGQGEEEKKVSTKGQKISGVYSVGGNRSFIPHAIQLE